MDRKKATNVLRSSRPDRADYLTLTDSRGRDLPGNNPTSAAMTSRPRPMVGRRWAQEGISIDAALDFMSQGRWTTA
jgi:hypothetical protein